MNRRIWVAVALFGILFINYMDRAALAVAAKPIATEFNLSPVAMGYLFSSFLWSYIACLIPIGILVDKIGTKRLIGGGLALWSIATAAVGGAFGFSSFLIARLVMGAGEATTYPAAAKVIRDWSPERERGQFHTIFSSGTGAGTAFGNIAIAWLVSLLEWRAAFILVGLFGLLLTWPWMKLFGQPEEVSWLADGERAKILSERNDSKTAEAQSHEGPPSGILHLLSQVPVMGLMITQGCNVYITYLFASWLPTFMQQTFGLSLTSTGLFSALPYVGMIVLSIVIAKIADKIITPEMVERGQRRVLIALTMLVGILIALTPAVHNIYMLLALFTVVITMLNVGNAFTQALANDLLTNPRDAGRVMSLVILGGNICGLTAPIVTGYIVAGTGAFEWAFWVAGAIALVGAVAVLTLCRRGIVAEDRLSATAPARAA